MSTILVVDDEDGMREFLSILLQKDGYDVRVAGNVREAREALRQNAFDLTITDLKMEGREEAGLEVLRECAEVHPSCAMIVLTAYGSIDTAVQAVRLGAYDYLSKPFENEELLLIVKKALEDKRLRRENVTLREELRRTRKSTSLIGQSSVMVKLNKQIERVSPLDATVLIRGESGTGKELVARSIHMQSPRERGPFIPVNCGGIPETLLESELFGHVKGAFTGADSDRLGLFEAAQGGTLFLDEITETPAAFQVNLLRVIEERTVRKVGSPLAKPVDVRILSATNRDLKEAIREGLFREDLYFRLNVVTLDVPPLRDREGDIRLLAQYFLKKHQHGDSKEFSEEALARLVAYSWPGNVRELEHCIENICIMAEGALITLDHFPEEIRDADVSTSSGPSETGEGLDEILDRLERGWVASALEKTGRRQTEAAQLLKITPRSLRYRMRKHGIDS